MKFADLHLHTTYSDGTFSPERVVKEAAARQISCISITDHDQIAGIAPAIKAARAFDIEVIPGIELSTESNGQEVHILGYCIDWRLKSLRDRLNELCAVRKTRALEILDKLSKKGILLDQEELFKEAGPGSVGRLHIARILHKEGFVYSIQNAFDRYIGNNSSCYVRKFKLTPMEAIELIRSSGGVAVLAHPHDIVDEKCIPEFVGYGLKGIEAYYPDYDKKTTDRYLGIAKEYGLLVTGGSDCHGAAKSRILMGEVKLPYSLVEALKEEAAAKNGKKEDRSR